MTAERVQCVRCGRVGSRQFVPLGLGGYACAGKIACNRRRNAFLGPLLRVTRRKVAA